MKGPEPTQEEAERLTRLALTVAGICAEAVESWRVSSGENLPPGAAAFGFAIALAHMQRCGGKSDAVIAETVAAARDVVDRLNALGEL